MVVVVYTVLQKTLMMLDAVDLGNLLKHKTMIEKFHDNHDRFAGTHGQVEAHCATRVRPDKDFRKSNTFGL